MAAFDPATRLGSTLRGKWTLERLLGTGGMAAVYVGAHKIGRRDAIKLLHPEVAAIRDLRERFEQEAHAVNRFRHPGAVEVRDIDVGDDGAPFLVMELLEGESLLERVRSRGLSTPELLRWVDELLDVLAAAHASGIVHRDIKPDNLFLTRDPRAPGGERLKVLDFGIARLREGARSRTALGARLGTVAYMPPEQVRGGAVDHRVDLFATGATMFRLLARRRIHEASTEGELLGLMATTPAPPLRSVAPEVPEHVALVVDRALAFDPRDRYPDATSMQLDVRALREGREPPFATQGKAAAARAGSGEPTVHAPRGPRALSEAPTEAPSGGPAAASEAPTEAAGAAERTPRAGERSTSVTVPAITLDAPTVRRDDGSEATTLPRRAGSLDAVDDPFPSSGARAGLAPMAASVPVLGPLGEASAGAPTPPLAPKPLEHQPFVVQPLEHQPLVHQPSTSQGPLAPLAPLEGQGPTLPSAPAVRLSPPSGPAVAVVTAPSLPAPRADTRGADTRGADTRGADTRGARTGPESAASAAAWSGQAPFSEPASRAAVAVGVAERRPSDRTATALLVAVGVVALVAVGALVLFLAAGGDEPSAGPREPAAPPPERPPLAPSTAATLGPRPLSSPRPSPPSTLGVPPSTLGAPPSTPATPPTAPIAPTATPTSPSGPSSPNPAAPEAGPRPTATSTAAPAPSPNPARPMPAPTGTAPAPRPSATAAPAKEPPGKGRGKDKDKGKDD